MRKFKIITINPTSGIPASIEIADDATNAFHRAFKGRFYQHPTTADELPPYTTPAPAGYALIKATTFDIVENAKYAGRYTVYTPVSDTDSASSTFATTKTTIRVNEAVPNLAADQPSTLLSDGYVTNVSTYILMTSGTPIIVSPETTNVQYSVELLGRDSSNWGEAFNNNFVRQMSNFAGPSAPTKPLAGQVYYDTDDEQMRVWNGTSWTLLNQASFGVTHRHTQGSPANIWVVNHFLALSAPYIAICQFYVDRGGGPQIIIPSDVQFTSANQLRVTFSNPEIGYVLVRQ